MSFYSHPTPHTRPNTTQSRHNNYPFSNAQLPPGPIGPQTARHAWIRPPSDYPGSYYIVPMDGIISGPPIPNDNTQSALQRNVETEGHWRMDSNGQIISVMGRVQEVPSDAETADLENLESVPLPANATPPPPPPGRSARLPSVTPSLGPSGPSRMGSPLRTTDPELAGNSLLNHPGGTQRLAHDPTILAARLREIMDRDSPEPRVLPDQVMTSSPLPISSPELFLPRTPDPPNRQGTFSPFRRNSSRARTRGGSSLDPRVSPIMSFEPQSTSSPPLRQAGNQSRSTPQAQQPRQGVNVPSPPPPPPPPRRPPTSGGWASPPQHTGYQDPWHQHAPYPQMPVNLPPFYGGESDWGQEPRTDGSRYQSSRPPNYGENQPRWSPGLAEHSPRGMPFNRFVPYNLNDGWPGTPALYDHSNFPFGYAPHPPPEDISRGARWDGRGWAHPHGPGSQDHPPLRRSTPNRTVHRNTDPLSLRAQGKQRAVDPPIAPGTSVKTPLAPSRLRHATPPPSPTDGTPASAQKRLDILLGPIIQEQFLNLDSVNSSVCIDMLLLIIKTRISQYFKRQTDPTLTDFLQGHVEITTRMQRIFEKLTEFLKRAVDEHEYFQLGTENWQKRWRKQLCSLERTMDAFCKFSTLVCNREATLRVLDKVLPKLMQYETKFRDVAKKMNNLIRRLQVRGLHASLTRMHTEAQEKLHLARSKRDLPTWERDKEYREMLRQRYVDLRNDIASSRQSSWAKTPPARRV
ncbi:hypothetical protein H0H87_001099 [Tephrocybe sp. NHM501043]|nr:hypothetical protein H0H87_001099 [Tephrocybe sp. NHM501043]